MLCQEDVLSFYERLRNHDWFYFYSDDPNINSRGAVDEAELRIIADREEIYRKMYTEFYDAKFNGKKIPEWKKFI